MVYRSNFCTSIKVNGKILRESDDGSVALPFGSEFTLLLKNLNSVRAMVKVTINGVDATEDVKLIVPADQSVELKRFIKNGDHRKGNAFKFIERTSAIEEHRGISEDDGLVRVEVWFEKIQPVLNNSYYWWNYSYPNTIYGVNPGFIDTKAVNWQANLCDNTLNDGHYTNRDSDSGVLRSAYTTTFGSLNTMSMNCSTTPAPTEATNTAGITVPGSLNTQAFTTGSWFPTEDQSHVIVVRLVGKVGEKVIAEPITVKAKPTCETCGRVNKSSSKFCNQCGTSLVRF